ncbi:helix-turn-helix domain-containing protein [Brevundimonas pondensis]|uniref:MerR family transcriptional regulator n=1 Tax=Brevundimonas pondensis TaxID=2774189 RepID=UPI00320B31A0
MSRQGLTIGHLALSTGVNLETVRYYERIGLMPSPARTQGGHRCYEPEHAQRLRFIRRSRELGFGIDAIRRLIALSEPTAQSCSEVRDMAQDHLVSIEAKIADLQRLQALLKQTVADCGDGGQVRCPVIEELGAARPG